MDKTKNPVQAKKTALFLKSGFAAFPGIRKKGKKKPGKIFSRFRSHL